MTALYGLQYQSRILLIILIFISHSYSSVYILKDLKLCFLWHFDAFPFLCLIIISCHNARTEHSFSSSSFSPFYFCVYFVIELPYTLFVVLLCFMIFCSFYFKVFFVLFSCVLSSQNYLIHLNRFIICITYIYFSI
jgi:hypothetical protein